MLNISEITTKNIKIQYTTQRFDEEFTLLSYVSLVQLPMLGPLYYAQNYNKSVFTMLKCL